MYLPALRHVEVELPPNAAAYGVRIVYPAQLRFERGHRFYRLHLEQDLWGAWCLARVNGGCGRRSGQWLTTWPGSYDQGLARMADAAAHTRKREYQLVPRASLDA